MTVSENDIAYLRDFFSKSPVKRAFIFGSYSRNEADENSDPDILVELDYSKHISLGFVKMKCDIEEALGKKVDLLSEQSVSRYMLPFINRDKKLICERSGRRRATINSY